MGVQQAEATGRDDQQEIEAALIDEIIGAIYAHCGKEAQETVDNIKHALWVMRSNKEERCDSPQSCSQSE